MRKKFEKHIVNLFLGKPFQWNGDGRPGLDCFTFLQRFYEQLGHYIDGPKYDLNWAKEGRNLFIENYHKQFDKTERPTKYGVILFNGVEGVAVHCGIYLSDNKFIHCTKRHGVCINELSAWQGKIQGYYKLKCLQ